jgi:hypothetical protein
MHVGRVVLVPGHVCLNRPQLRVYTYMCVHKHMCINAHMYVYMYKNIYIYIYIYSRE